MKRAIPSTVDLEFLPINRERHVDTSDVFNTNKKMKLKTVLFLIVLSVFAFIGCEKDNESKGLITISGITELDNSANNIGNVDPTDWKFTDTWSLNEEALFKKSNPDQNSVTEQIRPESSNVVIGYPNPARDMIFLAFQLDSGLYYDVRIVDRNLDIKLQMDSVNHKLITMQNSKFSNNELYRLYYKVYSNAKVYRGHGDFKFVN